MLGTQGDFLPDEKVTKESPRGVSPLGTPLGGLLSSPQQRAALLPPEGLSTGSWGRTSSLCFPPRPRMPRAVLSATNTARAGGGGIQGGPPPCAGGPGTRRFLAYLCLLSLREKVGRGAGRSARSLRVWELCSHIGGCGGAAPQRKLSSKKKLFFKNFFKSCTFACNFPPPAG